MRPRHDIALWAGLSAFFGSLLAVGVFDLLSIEGWAEFLASVVIAVFTAGAVYSKERLDAAKRRRKAMAKQLSKHFNSREFDCRDGTPVPKRDYAGLEYLCKVYLEPLRAKYGPVRINSGYRTASYNARIGGASKSYHVYPMHEPGDEACDISCRKGGPRDWHRTANWIRQNKRDGRGGLGLYSTFVHIDLRDYAANWKG